MATALTQDVKITADSDGIYDLVIDETQADFDSVNGFDTAIPVSLFTDSRAPSSIVPDAKKRRGWIGDILTKNIDRELGCLLWTLDQARNTQSEKNLARLYAQDAFSWMIEDRAATNITVSVESLARKMSILTNIYTPDNEVQRYRSLWRQTNAS